MYDFEAFLNDPTATPQKSPVKANKGKVNDEYYELVNNPFSYVRRKIRFQVEDCLWLEDLKMLQSMLHERAVYRQKTLNRCVLCTLPLGTCEHGKRWEEDCGPLSAGGSRLPVKEEEDEIDKAMRPKVKKFRSPVKDEVSNQMDDLFEILSGGVQIKTMPLNEEVDIDRIRWYLFKSRLSDKIGDTYLSISVPTPRGWHSMVNLGRYIVLYGGFRYLKSAVPQPFSSAIRSEDVEYLSDVYVYDTENLSWHHPEPEGVIPPGRYGHIAARLDNHRMVMFGGRGVGGKFYQDAWVYDITLNQWSGPLYGTNILPGPNARCFATAISAVPSNEEENSTANVYLFGGTDGIENFCDLWILKCGRRSTKIEDMIWEKALAVGPTPSPRYGHRMVYLGNDLAAIVGGCCVSPQSEISGESMPLDEMRRLYGINNALLRSYQAEGDLPLVAGKALSKSQTDMTSLLKQASSTAGAVQHLEAETRANENRLVEAFYKSEANRLMSKVRARHPYPEMDISFLNVKDLTWSSTTGPTLRGKSPSSRMHFSAECIGPYLLVVGGTPPTSLSYHPIDTDYSRTYALDTRTMRWIEPRPVDTTNYFDEPIKIAETDVLRARRRVDDEKLRGMSHGVRRGETVALAEAEAVLEICKWRLRMLTMERESFRPPPSCRFGHTLCTMKKRAILLGGWDDTEITSKEESYVLDMEPELERNRRIEEEFEARLERDRVADETANLADSLSAQYEMRMRIAAEKADQARERELMAIEEIRCCVPPISKPNPVRFVKASHNTIWVEWDPVEKNSNNDVLDEAALSKVTYLLWMKGGFEQLQEGDRVFVKVAIEREVSTVSSTEADDDDELTDDEHDDSAAKSSSMTSRMFVEYRGEITVARLNGLFDITFDDGTTKSNVPRRRIRLERPEERASAVISSISEAKSRERRIFRDRYGRKHREHVKATIEEEMNLQKRAKKLGLTLRPKKHWKDAIKAPTLTAAEKARLSFIELLNEQPSSPMKQEKKFEPTVQVGPEWRLVYSGPDLGYSCEGLVPDAALIREIPEAYNSHIEQAKASLSFVPTLKVEVTFALQVVGVDYPIEEHSKLSDPQTFKTRPCMYIPNMAEYDTIDAAEDHTITTASGVTINTQGSDGTAGTSETVESAATVRRVTLSTTVYLPEDDVPDKSILLKLKSTGRDNAALKPASREKRVDLKNALHDEWLAEHKAASEEKSAKDAEHQVRMERDRQSRDLESLVSARPSRIRAAIVNVTKIGPKTVVGEGISHDYV